MKLATAALQRLSSATPVAALRRPPTRSSGSEDIDSPRAMAWVETQNAADRGPAGRRRALPDLPGRGPGDLHRHRPHSEAGLPRRRGRQLLAGRDQHPRRLAHRPALDSFKTAAPAWSAVLDLDKLAKDEGRNWFWKGATCLKPDETLCLVRLSNGGGDAVELREFDTVSKTFVQGGFRSAEGKQSADWIDRDSHRRLARMDARRGHRVRLRLCGEDPWPLGRAARDLPRPEDRRQRHRQRAARRGAARPRAC